MLKSEFNCTPKQEVAINTYDGIRYGYVTQKNRLRGESRADGRGLQERWKSAILLVYAGGLNCGVGSLNLKFIFIPGAFINNPFLSMPFLTHNVPKIIV